MKKMSYTFNASAKFTNADVEEFFNVAAGGSNLALSTLVGKHGADILHARDSSGRTALMRATETGHSGAIHVLVKHGADVNAADKGGDTALNIAAYNGNKSIVQALLDRGADIEQANYRGQRPLMLAATHRDNNDKMHPMSKKKKETVQLLLGRGAQTEPQDNKGFTAETWARGNGYPEVADAIATEERRRSAARKAELAVITQGLPHEVAVLPRLRLKKGPATG